MAQDAHRWLTFARWGPLRQDPRAASVRALTDGVLLALHREDFNKLLGSLSHIRHMWRFEALRKARMAARAPSLLPPPRGTAVEFLQALRRLPERMCPWRGS